MKSKIIITVVSFILLICIYYFINKNILLENISKDLSYNITKLFVSTKEVEFSKEMLIEKNEALQNEINELNNMLNINDNLSTYSIINSTVINRNMKEFFDTVIIDKGSNDGIKIGDCVVNNDGLIGKIIKLGKHTSTVKLITSSDLYNMFSVLIHTEDGDIYGILSDYDEYSNSFVIEGIDELTKIKVGDNVATTGLGDTYPAGISIGKVVRISKDNFDLAYILKVESNVNFSNFHYVAVLNRDAS